jgi:hypothetical protein
MKTILAAVLVTIALAGTASATPQDDTTSGSIGSVTIQNVTAGHSSFGNFFFTFPTTCGTGSTYNTNGVRVSTSHPRYSDMMKTLLAATLSRATVIATYENISGQCWLKRLTMWNP